MSVSCVSRLPPVSFYRYSTVQFPCVGTLSVHSTHTHEVASRALSTRRDSRPAPPPNTFESNIALRAEVLKNVDEH